MFSPEEIDRFKGICSSFGVNVSKEMIEKFEAYVSLLLEWNARIHLISKDDARSERILRHFVDSLLIFKAVDIPRNASLLDLGAGAGFPSIPIKIVRSDIHLVLVESTHKKALFLQKLCDVLQLESVRVMDKRAEEIQTDLDFIGKFDLATAKALGKLSVTASLAAPFLRIGGLVVAYKGSNASTETICGQLPAELTLIRNVTRISIPEMGLDRSLIVLERSGKE
jgi:16S rRNA (guanine527-N7)-methyltransferase